jgi:hypothetical protein
MDILSSLDPIIHTPGAYVVSFMKRRVAFLPDRITARALHKPVVHELDFQVCRANIDQPVKCFYDGFLPRANNLQVLDFVRESVNRFFWFAV